MARAYLLGIGGSGSKVLEAFVHLCAAGLGPKEVCVGLVDQDAGNGHVAHVQQLVEEYERARECLRPHAQDTLGPDTGLLRSTLLRLDSGLLWQPEERHNATLTEHILKKNLLTPQQQQLMDCLFSPEEQTLPLDKGFCGRPNLGAVVFANVERGSRFWKELTASLHAAVQSGEEVRIFLTGSICGGTGAAGFPTLSRLLRQELPQHRVRLGGALLLPYFTFPSQQEAAAFAADSSTPVEVAADSAAFLEEAAEALAYYHHLLHESPIFDQLYLLGSDPLHVLKHRSLGGPDQRNPPLVPEVYAALAAARFMARPPEGKVVQYIGRAAGRVLGWNDLPGVADGSRKVRNTREHLGRLLRFAHAFNSVYGPHLRGAQWKAVRQQAWFINLITREGVDLAQTASQETLEFTRHYCQKALGYFSDLTYGGSTTDLDIELVKATQYAAPVQNDPGKWSQLHEPVAASAARFAQLITGPQDQADASLRQIMEGLAYASAHPTRQGLGVFCGTLFDHCAVK